MADKTQFFGLNKYSTTGRLDDDGHKFTSRDRDIIDAALWTLLSHDHSASAQIISGPVARVDYTVANTGGTLPAGIDRFYRYSYMDDKGNETYAAIETSVLMPDPVSELDAPTVTGSASGGALATGIFKYAVGLYQNLSQTRRTNAPHVSVVEFVSGATNKVTITLPDTTSADADGWDVWRQAPGDSKFFLLDQVPKLDEIQSLYNNSSSGTFTITFDGSTTDPIAYDAAAVSVEAHLAVLGHDVSVTGAGVLADPWLITFHTGKGVPQITTNDGGMDGSSTIATTQQGATADYVDDGGTTPSYGTIRPNYNNTNSENKVTLRIPDSEKPLPSTINAWRIYRTNRSGSYNATSLLATVSDTVASLGGKLRDTFEDVGGELVAGVPLNQSTIPSTIPALSSNAALNFFLNGTLADGAEYARATLRHDLNVYRIDAHFGTNPSGVSGSNYVRIGVSDGVTTVNLDCQAAQSYFTMQPSFWTSPTDGDFLEAEDADLFGGTYTAVTDVLSSGGQAVETDAGAWVRWNIGNVPIGDYLWRWVAKKRPGSNPNLTFEVYDAQNTAWIVQQTAVGVTDTAYALFEYAGTVSASNNDLWMRFTQATNEGTVDYFEYEPVIPAAQTLTAGSELFVTVEEVGSVAGMGGNVNLTIW